MTLIDTEGTVYVFVSRIWRRKLPHDKWSILIRDIDTDIAIVSNISENKAIDIMSWIREQAKEQQDRRNIFVDLRDYKRTNKWENESEDAETD